LEILQFPTGKGDPKWQQSSGRLFLGIDHTAIVVSDTDRSLRFYRDRLGFRVAGESNNYGTEQEHLNNVFGANLRITAIRAASGPGIEFLEYLSPSDGRPYPADAKPNDLIHWQTRVSTPGIRSAAAGFRLGNPVLDQLLVRDPDGHAILLTDSARSQAALAKNSFRRE
jgi:catechol 2,3-dioxygenase-like lactoylglutathione lyase family enzyme